MTRYGAPPPTTCPIDRKGNKPKGLPAAVTTAPTAVRQVHVKKSAALLKIWCYITCSLHYVRWNLEQMLAADRRSDNEESHYGFVTVIVVFKIPTPNLNWEIKGRWSLTDIILTLKRSTFILLNWTQLYVMGKCTVSWSWAILKGLFCSYDRLTVHNPVYYIHSYQMNIH